MSEAPERIQVSWDNYDGAMVSPNILPVGLGHRDYKADIIAEYIRADLTRQAPKVKPLEWVTFDACTMWADTIVGTWHINAGQGGGFTFKLGSNPIIYTDANGDEWSEWPSIDAAKAAAQADYERRILSALEE